jgi:hypothetical protein
MAPKTRNRIDSTHEPEFPIEEHLGEGIVGVVSEDDRLIIEDTDDESEELRRWIAADVRSAFAFVDVRRHR